MPNSFKDDAPVTPKDYIDLGLSVTPCNGKQPVVKNWQERGLQIEVWNHKYKGFNIGLLGNCLLYTSPSPRDGLLSRMPSSA